MKIIKTVLLGLLLVTVVSIGYLNNLTTEVNNPPEEYLSCSAIYYHPTYTFINRYRSNPDQGLFWITNDKQAVEDLMLMPGMKISLNQDEESYSLMYKDNDFGGTGIDVTKEEAEYLVNNIPGLAFNGDQAVEVTDYFGYIDSQLAIVKSNDMLGQASGCKENK